MQFTVTNAAAGFAALGSEPRLEVLRCLVRAGHRGLAIGAIGQRTGMPGSTLAHHLRILREAGLIDQSRDGRSVVSRARFGQVRALAGYVMDQCCTDTHESASREAPR